MTASINNILDLSCLDDVDCCRLQYSLWTYICLVLSCSVGIVHGVISLSTIIINAVYFDTVQHGNN